MSLLRPNLSFLKAPSSPVSDFNNASAAYDSTAVPSFKTAFGVHIKDATSCFNYFAAGNT